MRATYYDTSLQRRPSWNTIKHLNKDNLSLITCRQQSTFDFQHIFLSKAIIERCTVSLQTKETGYIFPLYLYIDPKDADRQSELLELDNKTNTPARTPNLDPEIVADIAKAIELIFTNEKSDSAGTLAPIDILDYIYAVLHSPTYRETYKEFLKIDFPRVPYPSGAETFWQLVTLGGELRQIHLLESPKLAAQIDGTEKSIGKVWINDDQYFDNVPLIAWDFFIGGYQPAQKWLKDRRERTLDHNDIKHYMNIIAALSLTDTIMQQIDEIEVI